MTGKLCVSISPHMTAEQHEAVLAGIYAWMPLRKPWDVAIGGNCRNTIQIADNPRFEESRRFATTKRVFDDWGDYSEADIWIRPDIKLEHLQITAAHEFGHMLGLAGHVDDDASVMASEFQVGSVVTDADWQRVWDLY